MSNDEQDWGDNSLETFYVYRSLHSDESWKAILADGSLRKLPNIDFGMRVYAINEKEAITRARYLYEKIHAYDSDKENIRRFATAALKSTSAHYIGRGPLDKISDEDIEKLATITMRVAVQLNEEYNRYFEEKKETSKF
jgi:hypothetical protein